jgi:hypothetical protein
MELIVFKSYLEKDKARKELNDLISRFSTLSEDERERIVLLYKSLNIHEEQIDQ